MTNAAAHGHTRGPSAARIGDIDLERIRGAGWRGAGAASRAAATALPAAGPPGTGLAAGAAAGWRVPVASRQGSGHERRRIESIVTSETQH